MSFNLSELLDWTRRAGGDRLQRAKDSFAGDGTTTEFTLSNEGEIKVVSVTIDGEATTDFTLTENTVVLETAPGDTDAVVVSYSYARYLDSEIVSFMRDAVNVVGADLRVPLVVGDDGVLSGVPDGMCDPNTTAPINGLQRLIVLAAADVIGMDKSSAAADESIMIRDGSTTIDTSKASGASDKAIERISSRYQKAMKTFRASQFKGVIHSEPVRRFPFDSGRRHDSWPAI